jgi:hypothetical protein
MYHTQQKFKQNQRTTSKPVVIKHAKSVKTVIQPKLKIGAPNDKYKQEADRVADQVMWMSTPVQSSSINNSQTSSVSNIQRKCAGCASEDELIQKKSSGVTPEVTPSINSNIQSLQGGGQPLSKSERSFFEPRFGADFSDVRLHTDDHAVSTAQSINARAFTYGNNVVFGAGEYSSESVKGQKLIAHELTHVVQQQRGFSIINREEGDQNNEEESVAGSTAELNNNGLFRSIWNDIVNQQLTNDQINAFKLNGLESRAIFSPFAALLTTDFITKPSFASWLRNINGIQELNDGDFFIIDIMSSFLNISIDSYLSSPLFVSRLNSNREAVAALIIIAQTVVSGLALRPSSNSEIGSFEPREWRQHLNLFAPLLNLIFSEQLKSPGFFDNGPLTLSTHPAFSRQERLGAPPPEGITIRNDEGVGNGQGGSRIQLALALNLARILRSLPEGSPDVFDLEENRGWQGSVWFNFNRNNPTQLLRDLGQLNTSSFRAGALFGGGGFFGNLEVGSRYRENTEGSRQMTAFLLGGGFGYNGTTNEVFRRIGFTARYVDWEEQDILAPISEETGQPESGRALELSPFSQLNFNINRNQSVSVGAALSFVLGSNQNLDLSSISGNISYEYMGNSSNSNLPQFKIDLSASLHRLDWFDPNSPLLTGLQTRVSVGRFFIAGQLNFGAGQISEERAFSLGNNSGERVRAQVPTSIELTGGFTF